MAGAPQNKIDPEFNYDMTQNLETWEDFNSLAKWVGGLTILILVAMFIFIVPHG